MHTKLCYAIAAALLAASLTITPITRADNKPVPPPLPESSIAVLRAISDASADIAARVKPSVVTVLSAKTVHMPRNQRPFGGLPFDWYFGDEDSPRPYRSQPRDREFKQQGMGSGIIMDKEGHILTNNHVIDDTDELRIKLPDGTFYDAEVVGSDPRTDVAILKFKGKVPAGIVPATFGDSDALRVGEWVMSVGAPFGYEQTVTSGIISAKGRTDVDEDTTKYQDFLQTDAAINPGNSGGPLVNLRGEVVGINTAIATSVGQFSGVGFAIPINMVKHVMRDLVSGGKVSRGFLGVIIQDVSPELAEELKVNGTKGAAITRVTKDSPASRAGLKVGDVIVRFNDKPIDNTRELHNLVAETDPDSKVDMIVVRDGKERTVNVVVGAFPEEASAAPSPHGNRPEAIEKPSAFGLAVEPLTPKLARDLGYEKDEGVLISEVANNSTAEAAGLRPGDLIVEVNHDLVTSVSEYRAAVAKSAAKVLLLVKNKDGSRFVVLAAK
jgi:serine protease Do